ncbi:recombinase family protein [Yersinia pekkanenii]|uniref:Resolvase n=1 Tax=Yersinia pekkanenii TaxID=1288385 RepID=A0ABP2A047_9GAMM|nr:putative resolvase [Yersinia pekkanenii]
MITFNAAVAEAERERILERTNDGRVAALAAGVKFGRKIHSRTPAALMLILQGEGVSSVTDKTGISRATYFRLKRKIKNDAKKEHLSQVDSM